MANSEARASNKDNSPQASVQAEQEEPTLHKIKSMLVDIQITVSSMDSHLENHHCSVLHLYCLQ